MSFSIISLYQCKQTENIALFSKSQIAGGIVDSVLVTAVCIIASLFLAHLSGIVLLPNYISYILLGSVALVVLADAIILIIQSYKKFTSLTEKLNTQPKQNSSAIPSTNEDKDKQIQILSQQLEGLKTKTQQDLKEIESEKDSHIQTLKQQKMDTDNQIQALSEQLKELKTEIQYRVITKKQDETQIQALLQKVKNLQIEIQQQQVSTENQEVIKNSPESVGVEIPPPKLHIVVDLVPSKNDYPYIQKDKLFVSKEQAELMKNDRYFNTFLRNDLDTTISGVTVNVFLANLKVFLNPKINLLCKEADVLGLMQIKQEIKKCFKDFDSTFIQLGLFRNEAFVYYCPHLIATGMTTVLQNLHFADLIHNSVLVLFWCHAIEEHVPLEQCIDQFEKILTTPLSHPEYLHEILFETLLGNFWCQSTQDFFNTYPCKLKIKTLDICPLLTPIGFCYIEGFTPENKAVLDRILNRIDCEYIEILRLPVSCKWPLLNHIMLKCSQIVCLQYLQDFARIKETELTTYEMNMPVVDFTECTWQAYVSKKRLHSQKRGQGKGHSNYVKIIYQPKDQNRVNAYLRRYRGIELKDLEVLSQKDP